MMAGKRGKFASTKFKVAERLAGFTLLRCLPQLNANIKSGHICNMPACLRLGMCMAAVC